MSQLSSVPADLETPTPHRFLYPAVSLVVAFVLPVALLGLGIALNYLVFFLQSYDLLRGLRTMHFFVGFSGVLLVAAGYYHARFAHLPEDFFRRYWPLTAPVYLALAVLSLMLWRTGYTLTTGVFGNIFLSALLLGLLCTYGIFLCSFTIFCLRRTKVTRALRGLKIFALLFLVLALPVACLAWKNHQDTVTGDTANAVGHDVNEYDYRPFRKNNKVYVPPFAASLHIHSGYPRLDGAIALYPVYAAFAEATYEGLNEQNVHQYVLCSNTPKAYARLFAGDADIFFGVPPSDAQTQEARERGLTLRHTPLGKDAFVFFVHKDNPVDTLTVAQIRDIYTRSITNWKEAGGADLAIRAFQRPEGSGSQAAMQNLVMQGREMARPLQEERYKGMGGIVRGVADYRNGPQALGYSFRWYLTALVPNPHIKLLAVEGVLPTPENIRNGSYPLSTDILAVTARPLSPESQALLDWIRGPQGQAIVRGVGYVPLDDQ